MTAGTVAPLSEIVICNMALLRMGVQRIIASFADGTPEANACALWYPYDRDSMLNEHPWPWANGYQQLAQVAGPEINGQRASALWLRSYRWPSDCLSLRKMVITPPPLTNGSVGYQYGYTPPEGWRRPEGDGAPQSYNLTQDSVGRLIETDAWGQWGVTAYYTRAVNDPTQFSPDFADALAWRVGADLAVALGHNDKKTEYARHMAESSCQRARARAASSMQSDIPTLPTLSRAVRGRW